jgi:uncharacterized protein (TIGR02145 family)
MNKKNQLLVFTSIIIGIITVTLSNCKKDSSGSDPSDTTSNNKLIPVLTTNEVKDITINTATCGGTVTSDNGSAIIARGVCWNTSQNPTTANNKTSDGTGTGNFTSNIVGLNPNTTYYVRAYATNGSGTGYGSAASFTTPKEIVYGTITDQEGNSYKTVTIGTQTWMAENLRTKIYNDNSIIPVLSVAKDWIAAQNGAYCNYNNDSTLVNSYGRLYNWYTVNTGKLSPKGWHVPTDVEWTILENYLISNGYNYDGTTTENKIAKSLAATSLWYESDVVGSIGKNVPTNNSSGFNAVAGGDRGGSDSNGYFLNRYSSCSWWSSTDFRADATKATNLSFDSWSLNNNGVYNKGCGLSVRCVKD